MRFPKGLLALALGLLGLSGPTLGAPVEGSVFLGNAATTGQEAVDGFHDRGVALHLAMACQNEFEFLQSYSRASWHGKSWDDPSTPNDDSGLASWPLVLMLGKAAVLRDGGIEPLATRAGRPICSLRLGTEADFVAKWTPLAKSPKGADESAAAFVNRIYHDLFAVSGDSTSTACDRVARESGGGEPSFSTFVTIDLTRACLARQIRVVISDPRHGPWNEKGGIVRPELPGTSAGKLPCISDLDFDGFETIDGDWDMAVLEYTRLTHILYAVTTRGDSRVGLDLRAAIEVLNKNLLTLRSSPEQGATARESFNLATSCGNLPNQSGSAIDTVGGAGDTQVGRYNDEAKDALDGTTFWEDLLRFLVIVAIIVVAAAIAAAAAVAIAAAAAAATVVAVVVAVVVGVAAVVAVVGVITMFTASIEETENHLLMQNTSRYLKNKLMMAELAQQGREGEFITVAMLNEEVRVWLLKRMERIAEDDFVEYNSKPYARLSHYALLNLIDFACDIRWDIERAGLMQKAPGPCDDEDKAIVTAAAAILDLSTAKASVGSLAGRRLIPYRRLAWTNQKYYDRSPVTELGEGADSMIGALQVWTGQLRFAPEQRANPWTFGQMVQYSTSKYLPDAMILQIAVDKTTPRHQQYRHATREAYTSGDGWLITAGGTHEHEAQGLSFPIFTLYLFPVDDRGVGVPTTLMTDAATSGGANPPFSKAEDFLRFDGEPVDWGTDDQGRKQVSFSSNNCLAGTFACGLRPRLPKGFDPSVCQKPIGNRFIAIDTATCPAMGHPADPSRAIYVAFYDHDGQWGFFEVAPHSAFATVDDFIARVQSRNATHMSKWGGQDEGDEITYVTTDGRELKFGPEDEEFGADRRACGVVNSQGAARFTISDVSAAQSANCVAVGRRIWINLVDEMHPVRQAEGGAPLAPLF